VIDTARHEFPPARVKARAAASLMLLGLGERLAISVVLSGVAFLGVAWAIA